MCFLLSATVFLAQKYTEGVTVFPCQRLQYLLHCWQWSVYVNTTKQRNSCIFMKAVVRRTRHILTLYGHTEIFVNNVTMYTCFFPICIKKKLVAFQTRPENYLFWEDFTGISVNFGNWLYFKFRDGRPLFLFRAWIAPILRTVLWREELEWKIWLGFQRFVYL